MGKVNSLYKKEKLGHSSAYGSWYDTLRRNANKRVRREAKAQIRRRDGKG